MFTTSFDARGYIRLSGEILRELEIMPKTRIQIRVEMEYPRMVLTPVYDAASKESSAPLHSEPQKNRKHPVNDWQYLQPVDENFRLPLPELLRYALEWTESTVLTLTIHQKSIYVYGRQKETKSRGALKNSSKGRTIKITDYTAGKKKAKQSTD